MEARPLVIRCERCSTLYELDEALLSPGGSQVQCTKCQHVFTAYPAGAAGRTRVGVPEATASAPEPTRPEAPPPSSAEETPSEAAAPPRGMPSPASERRPDAPKASFSGSPPIYRPASPPPSPAAAAGVARAPLLRRDTVGAFEARLRWSARLRWMAPVVGALLLATLGAAWFLLARRAPPDDARARREAMALAARDDAGSLDEAAGRLEAALRRVPGSKATAADRAAVDVLRAAAALEEGEVLAARRTARAAQRDRLRRDQPAGWEDAEREAGAEAQALDREVRAREERARTLGGAAFDALRALQRAGGEPPEVGRGLGLFYALGGERAGVHAAVRSARGAAPSDPWLDLAEGWVEARQVDHAARERALVALATVSSAHPDLLRARYLLARTQAALGRRTEALASLDGLLASNGRHEGAQRLRRELATAVEPPPPAPPPAAAAPAPTAATPTTPPAESVPGNAPTHVRKRVSQPPAGAPSQAIGPTLAPIPGDGAPVPSPAAGGAPGEDGPAAPSAGPSAPAGAGAGEPAKEQVAPVRRPRSEEPDAPLNGG